MIPVLDGPGLDAIAALAFELGWKSTALFTVAGLLALLMWRRPTIAAAMAGAGLVATIALPLTVLVLPPLAVRLLPAERPIVADPEPLPAEEAYEPPPMPPVHLPAEFETEQSARDMTVRRPGPLPAFPLPRVVLPPDDDPFEIRPTAVLLAAYVAVVAVMLARLAFGLVAVIRLRRQAVAADEPEWLAALESWRTRLGIRRRVGLAWSSGVSVPVAIGWLRPMVLLPASAGALEVPEHADAILVHELAHIRRGDFAWNVIQRLAIALYWLHPLAWLLAKATAAARERACDDLCVHELGGPAGYRATLLAVASGLVRRPGPALGMAMARSPRLARRLRGIELSRGASRCLPRGRARVVIAATALVAVSLVGAARLTRAEPVASADEPPKAAAAPDAPGKVFRLQVVSAATGKPIPKANVRVWIALQDDWRVTDEEGRLDIRHSTGPADQSFVVDAWGDRFAMQRHDWGETPRDPVPDGATVRLMPGENLGGLVRDEQGRPISGATVYLFSHNYKHKDPHELLYDLRAVTGPDGRWKTSGAPETTGELLGFAIYHPDFLSDRRYSSSLESPRIADLRIGEAVSVMKKGIPVVGRVLDAAGRPVAGALVRSTNNTRYLGTETREFDVLTDSEGRFRTGQFPEKVFFFVARANGHAPADAKVRVRSGMPGVEIRLGHPRTLTGRVVDDQDKPVAGARVNVDTWRGYQLLGVHLFSDMDGRFHWSDAPEDDFTLRVSKVGYIATEPYRNVDPSTADLLLRLSPSLAISGTVRDAETKKKVEHGRIEYAVADAESTKPREWLHMRNLSVGVDQGSFSIHIPVKADAYQFRILADGFVPFVTRVFRREELVITDYKVNLTPMIPGTLPTARVLRPDGKPVAGARVYRRIFDESHWRVTDGVIGSDQSSGREVLTGPDGTFPVRVDGHEGPVLILGDDCYAYAGNRALLANPTIQAKPYARVEGRFLEGSRPVPGRKVMLSGHIQDRKTEMGTLSLRSTATTDEQGRFLFERVIPAPGMRVGGESDRKRKGQSGAPPAPVRVPPGRTATVTLGGTGMPVIGRVSLPRGLTESVDLTENSMVTVQSNRSWIPYPLHLFRGKTSLNDAAWSEWLLAWDQSEAAVDYNDGLVRGTVDLAPDGSFRIEDVPPGEYRLSILFASPERGSDSEGFAPIGKVFTVQRPAGGRSDLPLNLGTFTLQPRVKLKPGDPAPPIEITTTDGKKRSVPGDFRGKFLLLDFGTMWDMQSPFQITRMNDIQARFGKNEELSLLSLTLAEDTEATRKYVADKGEAWPQAIVGSLSNPIAYAYGVHNQNVPVAILIGPDGKIVGAGLQHNAIGDAVEKALHRD